MSRTREDFALHELAAGRPGAKELYDQVYADAENSGTTT